jgi:hypothetical protein
MFVFFGGDSSVFVVMCRVDALSASIFAEAKEALLYRLRFICTRRRMAHTSVANVVLVANAPDGGIHKEVLDQLNKWKQTFQVDFQSEMKVDDCFVCDCDSWRSVSSLRERIAVRMHIACTFAEC